MDAEIGRMLTQSMSSYAMALHSSILSYRKAEIQDENTPRTTELLFTVSYEVVMLLLI